MRVTAALVAALALSSLARADPPAQQAFTLYKFQNQIGVERSVDDGREVRTVFTFTDRTSPVPLASVLERGKDGTPVRFQLWGNTSRLFTADDRVVVEGGKLTITQRGQTRSVAAPARFFVGSAYAPVTMTQELLRYWASHGKPASLPVFPIGTISIERRGEDTVTDQDGVPRALERFAIGGLGWGKETVWLDDKHQLAALTGSTPSSITSRPPAAGSARRSGCSSRALPRTGSRGWARPRAGCGSTAAMPALKSSPMSTPA